MTGGKTRLRALCMSACAMATTLLVVSACSFTPAKEAEPATSGASAASVAEGAIPEDGMELSVGDSTTVVFPAGSATGAVPTAEVAAELDAPSVVSYDTALSDVESASEEDGVHVVALGDGASIELDDGQTQPSTPATVTFTMPDDLADAARTAAGDTGSEALDPLATDDSSSIDVLGAGIQSGNVALLLESSDGSTELVPATYDEATGQISGDVPHFSSVWPVSIDFSWLTDTVLQGLGVASPKPDCEGQSVEVADATYSTISQAQMWMCVAARGSGDDAGLTVLMEPNAGTPFVATASVPPSSFLPDTAMSGAAALATATGQVITGSGSVAVFPGAASRLYYDEPPGSFTVKIEAAPQLYVIQILSEVAATLLGLRGDALAQAMSTLDCSGDIIPTLVDSGSPAELMAGSWQSFFSCAEQAATTLGVSLSGSAGIVFAIVSAGPQLVIGGFLGALTTATGLGTVTAPVDARYADDEPAPGDVASFVDTWSGPITQSGRTYYGVEVVLSINPAGKLRGKVRYPELDNCSGSWVKPRLKGNRLRMLELIGGTTRCSPEIQIVLRLSPDGKTLDYRAAGGVAVGTLVRGAYAGLPEGTAPSLWPVDKREAPMTLNVWLGANMHNPMDWSACDVAGLWCVIGQGDGEDPIVVEMTNLRYAGSVPWGSSNPAESLRSVGMPAQSVQQALS